MNSKIKLLSLSIVLITSLIFTTNSIGQISFQDMDAKIDSILTQENIPGCQILIVDKDSVLWSKYFGFADLKDRKKVDVNTIFRIGSITKTFTAVAALQLQERKVWSLNDNLKTVNPSATFLNKYDSPVKLIHLMEHTSGIDDIRLKEYATNCRDCNTSEGLNYFNTGKYSRWQPGKFMSYSNWGAAYIAEALELKTKLRYEDYVKQNILSPLGMKNADFFLNPNIKNNIATGYSEGDELEAQSYEYILERASGALNTSAQELSYFLRLFLNNGRKSNLIKEKILSKESIIQMETVETTLAARQGFNKGYGKALKCSWYEGNEWFGHNGGMMGFQSCMYYNREIGKGFIILINKDKGINILKNEIKSYLIAPKKRDFLSESVFNDDFLGYYNSATSRGQMTRFVEYLSPFLKLYKDDDEYFIKEAFKTPVKLKLLSDNTFYHKNNIGEEFIYSFISNEHKNYLTLPFSAKNFIQKSGFTAWLKILLPSFIGLVFLIGLFLIPLFEIKKIRFNFELLAWLFIFSFFSMFLFLIKGVSGNFVMLLGKASIWSIGYFIFSLAFVCFGFFALISFFKNWNRLTSSKRLIYSIIISSFIISLIYLGKFEMIGLKTWQY